MRARVSDNALGDHRVIPELNCHGFGGVQKFAMESDRESREKISSLEWYRLFRGRIEHEDNLISQRLSWLVASQAFLFTAYAITTSGLSNQIVGGDSLFHSQARVLFRVIPIVAICIALLIYIGILAALKAIRELRHSYRAWRAPDESPPIQTSVQTRRLGLAAPVLLPIVFIVVWLALMIRGLG
jgi:hypothetical protein